MPTLTVILSRGVMEGTFRRVHVCYVLQCVWIWKQENVVLSMESLGSQKSETKSQFSYSLHESPEALHCVLWVSAWSLVKG